MGNNMKRLLLLPLLLIPNIASAQCNGVSPAGTICGNPSASTNAIPRMANQGNIVVTDPAISYSDTTFEPGSPVLNPAGLNVNVTSTSASSKVGIAVQGNVIGAAGAPAGNGALGGIMGGASQYQAGFDAFGILGQVSSALGVNAAGTAVYAILRGSANGHPQGQITTNEAWYGVGGAAYTIASLPGLYWGSGISIDKVRDTGFVVGIGTGTGPNPTFPFLYNRVTPTNGLLDITNITKTNPAQITLSSPHGYTNGDTVTLYRIGGMFAPAGPSDQHLSSLSDVNGISYVITVINPTTFSIPVDTTLYSNYLGAGTASKVQAYTYTAAFSVNSAGNVDGASFSSGGTAGVTCTAGTVNAATMTVKNGIVTHC